MHPDRRFHWQDRAAMRALVADVSFGQLFASTPQGPRVVHLPAVWLDDDTLGLHVARANLMAPELDGQTALFVVTAADGYISPDWYALPDDQVPTWNYVAVELEGRLTRMDTAGLLAQIDQLATEQEARLAPKPPWTRDKVDPAYVDGLVQGIVGYRLEVSAWRGTRKLGQNKPDVARLAAAAAAKAAGATAIARLMEAM